MEKHDHQMSSPADINSFNAADTSEEFEKKLQEENLRLLRSLRLREMICSIKTANSNQRSK